MQEDLSDHSQFPPRANAVNRIPNVHCFQTSRCQGPPEVNTSLYKMQCIFSVLYTLTLIVMIISTLVIKDYILLPVITLMANKFAEILQDRDGFQVFQKRDKGSHKPNL